MQKLAYATPSIGYHCFAPQCNTDSINLHLHLNELQAYFTPFVQGKAIFTGFVTLLASYLITLLAFAMLKFKNYEKKWEMKLAGATATQVGPLCMSSHQPCAPAMMVCPAKSLMRRIPPRVAV